MGRRGVGLHKAANALLVLRQSLPPPTGKATGQRERTCQVALEGLEMKEWWRTAALYSPWGEMRGLQLNLLLSGWPSGFT